MDQTTVKRAKDLLCEGLRAIDLVGLNYGGPACDFKVRVIRVRSWLYRVLNAEVRRQGAELGKIPPIFNPGLLFRGIPVVPGPRLEFVV